MDWVFYTGLTETDAMVSHRFDLDLATSSPESYRPISVEIWLAMRFPNSLGLASIEEGALFDKIESRLEVELSRHYQCRYVGLVTQDGRWQFIYYCPEGKRVDPSVVQSVVAAHGYDTDIEVFIEPDPEWKLYREVLYPTQAKHREQIVNYKQMAMMEWNGKGTQINFIILAGSSISGDLICELIQTEFVTQIDQDRVIASKSWNGVLSELNTMTWQLLDLCSKYRANYLGWQIAGHRFQRPELR